MNKNIKLVESSFSGETRISKVTIETDLGRFSAESYLRDEDLGNSSAYEGCHCAELKAVRKYIQARLKLKKEEIKTIKNLISSFEKSSAIIPHSRPCAILYRAYYKAIKEKEELQKAIASIGKELSDRSKIRDEFYKRIQALRAKKDKE